MKILRTRIVLAADMAALAAGNPSGGGSEAWAYGPQRARNAALAFHLPPGTAPLVVAAVSKWLPFQRARYPHLTVASVLQGIPRSKLTRLAIFPYLLGERITAIRTANRKPAQAAFYQAFVGHYEAINQDIANRTMESWTEFKRSKAKQ